MYPTWIHGPGLVSTSPPGMIKSRRITVCRGFGLLVQACENLGFNLIKCTCVADTFVQLAGTTVPQIGR